MTLPRPVRAVVFDMDGLLLDTETVFRDALRAEALAIGRDFPPEVFLQMLGHDNVSQDRMIEAHFGRPFDLAPFRAAVRSRCRAVLDAGSCLKAGVLELLDHLDACSLPRAIATSSTRGAVALNLGPTGIASRFDHLVTGDMVGRTKPHPEPFLTAAKLLGVEPRDCLALEDSYNGVRSAAAAGMMTVMVPDLLHPTDEMHGLCIRIAADLHEVRDLIRGARA